MMEVGEVAEDHCCSICLSVFYKPIKLKKCGHLFCRVCLEDATELVNLKACPLCRKPFQSVEMINQPEFDEQIGALYPNQIKEKIANLK